MLAGMSPDYLRRVEQGRVLPSDAVLDAFADALRFGPTERAHLQALADLARGRQRRAPPDEGIRPTLLRILEAPVPTPAVVLGRCCEVLAWNPTGAALDQVVAAQEPAARNVARRILLDPSARALYPQWDALAQEVTHVLKLNSTRFTEDRALRELIEELSRESAEFRRYWERQEVFEKTFGRKLLDHPAVGRLELEYESLEIAPLTGQVLIVYTAPPRFIWSEITPESARWEQAFSLDFETWERNWIMEFTRVQERDRAASWTRDDVIGAAG